MANDNRTPRFLTVTEVDENTLVFTFGNGRSLTFDATKTEATAHKAKMHGYKQKLSDVTARFSREKDYTGAYAEMADVIETLYNKDWNRGRAAGGGKLELLIAAIARIRNAPLDKVTVAVQHATEETRAAWLANKAIGAAMAEIRAERLKSAADEGEDTLDDLPTFDN